jgi:putative Mg2+ transporter-C (MgtC) family protein
MMSTILVRLGTAFVCGAILGLHVGLRDRPGGLRTHIMTALGAAAFCLTAQNVAGVGNADAAMRALQGIASGVGFIGGSVVLRRDHTVEGVATGASIWTAAALGCASGLGDWKTALAAAVAVAIINVSTFYFERKFLKKSPFREPREEPHHKEQ